MIKLYKIEFMQYTNAMKDTVSNGAEDIADVKYIDVYKDGFIVKESQIDFIKGYGGGIKNLEFIGCMEEQITQEIYN